MTIELKDLIGQGVLDGVDRETHSVRETWGDSFVDCEVLRFRLNGIVYVAIENPDDGYRSSMRELRQDFGPIKNEFPPVLVLVRHQTEGEYHQVDDLLDFVCIDNGKSILSVGTSNAGDYYPSFEADFRPENMPINEANHE